MKAISHTPDRDRVLPIAPEGTSETKRWQTVRKKRGMERRADSLRKEIKNRSINHRHENMGKIDNGKHSGHRMMDTKSTIT